MVEKPLTNQDIEFVEEYIETGNKLKSAKKAYKIKSYAYAGVKGHRLIKKAKIKAAIDEVLNDKRLEEKHSQLLDAVNLEKLYFDEYIEDKDVEEVVSQMEGYKLLKIIRNLDKEGNVISVFAYVKAPDSVIQEKALDKAYKLKGRYAPEKTINLNIEKEPSKEIKELTTKLNEIHRGGSQSSNGGTSSSLDNQTPD